MIHPDSLSSTWIDGAAAPLGRIDKALLEKAIRALYLTEQLAAQGLDFQFKGGTCLLLQLPSPRRFSIDVDIVTAESAPKLTAVLDRVVRAGFFSRWEEDFRSQQAQQVPVRHFKFYYTSHYPGFTSENYVLLDVVFQAELLGWAEAKPMAHAWLKTDDAPVPVEIFTLEGLLGDKLTAFAPKTTGILYSKNRPLEIVKQLYDIATLFDFVHDLAAVSAVFEKAAAQEIHFRNLPVGPMDVLDDAFGTALKICDRDAADAEFGHLMTGIKNIRPHIFQRFGLDEAIVAAAKAMYLNVLIRKKPPAQPARFSDAQAVSAWNISTPDFNRFNRLKKTNPEAFFYLYQVYSDLKN